MTDLDMSAYLGVFLDEVDEQLEILDQEILKLEQDGDNMEIIQNIFRAAHTLKGSSAVMGFEQMKEVTHKTENVLDLIRNRQLKVNTDMINVIFEAIDHIKVLKQAIINGTLAEKDISNIIGKLEKIKNVDLVSSNILKNETSSLVNIEDSGIQSFPAVSFDLYQKEIIVKAWEADYKAIAVYIALSDEALMRSVRALLIHNNLKEMGEVIASFPSAEEIQKEEEFQGKLVYILVTQESKQSIINIVNSISDIKTVSLSFINHENLDKYCEGKKAEFMIAHKEEGLKPKQEVKLKIQPTVRVDVERLEQLINLVGELVIDQTRFVDVRTRLRDRYVNDEDMEILEEVSNHIGRIIGELQEGMMKTRMLPIEQLFNRFPRMVRDLAQKANKEVDLVIEGKETELDRTLIEEIGDPLIHLLRNSLDHGIENPEERELLGKPKKGTVVLKAVHEENHIVITLQDDGRGIDPQKIKQNALKKGLLSVDEAERMSDQELIFFIFHAGVSTASQVTEISGRGVGMDIVKSHIEKLNGIIDIQTSLGKGTTFSIKLPLTLAIIPSLLVNIGQKKFAIPMVNVLEIVRLQPDEVKTIKNQEVGLVRGRVLPLIRMHQKLGAEEQENLKRWFVVVVGLADRRVGLVVDRTLGYQEIVIKPLGKFIGSLPYIAGATIMGDGTVGMILDVGSIIREEGIKESAENKELYKHQKKMSQEVKLVTFKLGHEEYATDIRQVKDIITVPAITKVMRAPFSVIGLINLHSQLIPVVDLSQRLHLVQNQWTRKTRIMVLELGERLIGILVDQVTEVLNVNVDVIKSPPDNRNQVETKYIRGICHIHDRLLILLDMNLVLNGQELLELSQLPCPINY